ncbi:hypothetical protein Taro_032020 [Colocasia esculenta]|uniref:Uncharacterized protein n=1 Tax=Colocasia esculenta TaxID=4460 RepID=A0A843W4W7_COLES|nr:hypothetical protein [Colocasia esculenta]
MGPTRGNAPVGLPPDRASPVGVPPGTAPQWAVPQVALHRWGSHWAQPTGGQSHRSRCAAHRWGVPLLLQSTFSFGAPLAFIGSGGRPRPGHLKTRPDHLHRPGHLYLAFFCKFLLIYFISFPFSLNFHNLLLPVIAWEIGRQEVDREKETAVSLLLCFCDQNRRRGGGGLLPAPFLLPAGQETGALSSSFSSSSVSRRGNRGAAQQRSEQVEVLAAVRAGAALRLGEQGKLGARRTPSSSSSSASSSEGQGQQRVECQRLGQDRPIELVFWWGRQRGPKGAPKGISPFSFPCFLSFTQGTRGKTIDT